MATCFHHQDRETGRACTRCGRPACPECLTQASVGSHCFECIRAAAPKRGVRIRRTIERDPLLATKVIVAANVAAFVVISLRDRTISGNGRTSFDLGLTAPALHSGEWWRLFTYSFVHFGLVHIGFNMLVLYMVGKVFEPEIKFHGFKFAQGKLAAAGQFVPWEIISQHGWLVIGYGRATAAGVALANK